MAQAVEFGHRGGSPRQDPQATEGLGLVAWGLEFRVQGLGFRVWGCGVVGVGLGLSL